MNALINIFAKESGWIARTIASLIVGGIVAVCAKYGFSLSDDDNLKLSGMVTTGVAWIINEYINKRQSEGIAAIQTKMQEVLPSIVVDGHAGTQTVAASSQVSNLAQ